MTRADLALTRFANSFIHQNVADIRRRGPAAAARRRPDRGRQRQRGHRRTGCAALVRAHRRRGPALPARPGLAGAGPAVRRCRPPRPVDEATALRRARRAGRPGARVRGRRRRAWRRPATAAPRTGRRVRQLGRAHGVRPAPPRRRWTASRGPAARTGWPGSAPAGWPTSTARRWARSAAAKARAGGRPGRAAAGALRGGARAGRRGRPAAEPVLVRLQRQAVRRAAVVRRARARPSSTRR